MPSEHTISARTTAGTELKELRLTFGELFPRTRERPLREGWGWSIELPVVLDLLDAIDTGEEKASDTKRLLLKIADTLYGPADCYRQYESDEDKLAWCVRDGGCPTCEGHSDQFARYLETMAERWRRWELPEQYPFAAGSAKGLHTTVCGVVRAHMPEELPDHKPDDVEPLRAFAHAKAAYDLAPKGLEPLTGHVPFHPMTEEETRAWMAEHTGPKGGRYYKRCQHCAPTP